MRFKFCLLPALFVLLAGTGRAADLEWNGHGTFRFEVPEGWKITGRADENFGYAFRAKPALGVALLQISVTRLPADKRVIVDELPDRLQASLLPYIEQSVEKEFHPVVLKSRQGKGWYAELTDAALAGKPSVPDDYKVMRNALIALDRRTLVVATMQFDDASADVAGEMLAIITSLRFEPVTAPTEK